MKVNYILFVVLMAFTLKTYAQGEKKSIIIDPKVTCPKIPDHILNDKGKDVLHIEVNARPVKVNKYDEVYAIIKAPHSSTAIEKFNKTNKQGLVVKNHPNIQVNKLKIVSFSPTYVENMPPGVNAYVSKSVYYPDEIICAVFKGVPTKEGKYPIKVYAKGVVKVLFNIPGVADISGPGAVISVVP